MAFTAFSNKTQTVSVTGSNVNTALTWPDADTYEFNNAGTATVFFVWSAAGGGAVTSTTTSSYPILPGQCKVVRRPKGATHIAVIATSATQTLYVSAGTGE